MMLKLRHQQTGRKSGKSGDKIINIFSVLTHILHPLKVHKHDKKGEIKERKMRACAFACACACLLTLSAALPVKDKQQQHQQQQQQEEDKEQEELNLEYGRYLKEVVQALESDPNFRKKLEGAQVDDIKSGKIARELHFVDHNIRTKLDELKRRELERLRHLAIKEHEKKTGVDRTMLKVPVHIDHKNPMRFEVEDLKKLIIKTTEDLEKVDQQRRSEFKQYEMEKEFQRHQDLQSMDDEHRKQAEAKHTDEVKQHADHPKLHHPGSKQQLEQFPFTLPRIACDSLVFSDYELTTSFNAQSCRKEKGEGNSAIGRDLGLSESSVRTIWRKRDEIRASIKAYGVSKIDSRKQAPDSKVIKMERYLNAWISKKEREGVPENKKQIMEMAKEFYLTICDKEKVQPSGFQASTGWLYRFIDRKEVRNVNLTGKAASANSVAADNFPQILKDTIEEGSYDPECIYNMDECGLQYKMMPTSTFISRAKHLSDLHPKVKVLFYPPNTTSLLQPLDQEVIANVKTFNQTRVYALMRQQTETGEEIQAILDSGDEAGDIDDPLPEPAGGEPGTSTPPTQPDGDDQSARSSAPHHHLAPNPNAISVKQFWRQFTIKDVVTHMLKAWEDINVATIRHSWKKVAPSFVKNVIESEAQDLHDSVTRAVEVARKVPGFESVTEEEILAINSEGDNQSVEGIVSGLVIEDELAQQEPIMKENVESEYSCHQLSLILASAENLKQVVLQNEKSKMKQAEFVLQLDSTLRYYKQLYQRMVNKRKQTMITSYLPLTTSTITDGADSSQSHESPASPLPGEPQPGPSGEPWPGSSEVTNDEFTGFMRDVDVFRKSSRAINILTGPATGDGGDTDSE
ncbi:hypothetical protein Pcinc_019811 [Petrolisthes cinctipes]|uniref:HTH CENPB-type domain-containing protein n=1 Tax=Petrolisthes cinctipes TaxID=88211 RepID=A0AAE1KL18_PETCI|nr:hypothetical protein Pcinc_019811 [Petrolisthes cinctipes]